MQSFEIIKGQGGVRKAGSQDGVSGMVFYLPTANMSALSDEQKRCVVAAASDVDAIYPKDSANKDVLLIGYHLSEVFRINQSAKVFVQVVASSGEADLSEVTSVQDYAEGACRQIGVWNGYEDSSADHITDLQAAATAMEQAANNCSIVYCAKVLFSSLLQAIYSGEGKCNVSQVVAQDMTTGSRAAAVQTALGSSAQVGGLGTIMGCISKAAVNESIAWVAKFNIGWSEPAISDGKKINVITQGDLATLDSKRFIFARKYDGIAGCYWSDSHTMDVETSDFGSIEAERAIDKACRGVRTNLLPYLGSPVYVSDDGTLRADSLAVLQNVASQALEDMEKAGELSGYKVEIDPEQDILANSTIEFVIKNVAVGVMRHIKVKISYTNSID